MSPIPTDHVLLVAMVLFVIGLLGVLVRRDIVFVLMALEILLNSAVLAFAAAGARWNQPDGQVWVLFILATAAAEISVGLPLVLCIHRRHQIVDTDEMRTPNSELPTPDTEIQTPNVERRTSNVVPTGAR